MKQIMTIAGFLIVLAIAIFGCLLIFGVITFESAGGSFIKMIAAIALLGGCAALIGLLMAKKE
jgi:hypothetical protein